MTNRKFCRALLEKDIFMGVAYIILILIILFVPYHTGVYILENSQELREGCDSNGTPGNCDMLEQYATGFIMWAFCLFVFIYIPYILLRQAHTRYWIKEDECDEVKQ